MLVGMAGADYIHLSAGILDSGNAISFEQFIIDNEILGAVHRILDGITVNEDTLAVSCIEKVGPGGNFVTEDHTVEYMLKEYFYPDLAIRTNFDQWDVHPGMDLTHYMATQIREANYVLLICTPNFAKKADAGLGGVGYETTIVTGEIFHNMNPKKFIPLLFKCLKNFLLHFGFLTFLQSLVRLIHCRFSCIPCLSNILFPLVFLGMLSSLFNQVIYFGL